MKRVDDYQVEILLTLALVTGGYALATALHVSGLIAIVVAGLFIGNQGRFFAMSERTREHLDVFWEILDEILNIVLFTLIGLEVLAVPFTLRIFLSALALVPGALLARYVSVRAALLPLSRPLGVDRLLTWGGLRGAISIALALSVPTPTRPILLAVTYAIVVFSLIVQGSTMGADGAPRASGRPGEYRITRRALIGALALSHPAPARPFCGGASSPSPVNRLHILPRVASYSFARAGAISTRSSSAALLPTTTLAQSSCLDSRGDRQLW